MRACHDRSQLAISAIANGAEQEAYYQACKAIHEARYAKWVWARLHGQSILVAFSTSLHDRRDFTRNTGAYGHTVTWCD